ncbi:MULTISPECIES: hypothetical protein [Halolamina]|uniref:Uncharacterized protein n=1 Tax=Halolamina pelagica TaxID=699431 RepID=A0A1I5VIH8_9EURY|nr:MULTISPECIES: hypothetical protein [Halolamina]NHX37655.1 hypothetical protein [Halolamina sp. R1-12]SFQ07289.1 hypothetical protein SAMN05216277_11819 [Halolamina pelagica]
MSSDDGDDGGYVHTPGGVEGDDGPDASDGESGGPSGWILVGAITLATLVIPGIIYLYPTLLADHVPFLVAMLALPFVPALLLGVVGVWAMKG